jgi:hypothetical protein
MVIPKGETETRRAQAERRVMRARETIEVCRQLLRHPFAPGLALTLHDLHPRHARELGFHAMEERAEERYDRALQRQLSLPR